MSNYFRVAATLAGLNNKHMEGFLLVLRKYSNMEEENSKNNYGRRSGVFVWIKAFIAVGIILFAYQWINNAGWASKSIIDSELTLGISFLTGVAASFSTCLAVVGGMVIAFSEKYESRDKNFFAGVIRPNLYFHIGRLITFFFLGGILGFVGGTLNISGNFVSMYTIVFAVVMGWLGLNILGILPPISALGWRMPKSLTRLWAKMENSEHQAAPFLLGGLTFFLPCGFTQSTQVLALVSGSFFAGALGLLLFALGTMPVLMAVGVATSWARNKKFETFQKAAGILIIFFAIFSFQAGLALKSVKKNVISNPVSNSEKTQLSKVLPNNLAENQTVEMSVTSRGFEPGSLKIKKGTPVRWIIRGVSVSGCTNQIIIPSLDIAKNISSGENIISFVPPDVREIPFSCGMGMVRGKFILE